MIFFVITDYNIVIIVILWQNSKQNKKYIVIILPIQNGNKITHVMILLWYWL